MTYVLKKRDCEENGGEIIFHMIMAEYSMSDERQHSSDLKSVLMPRRVYNINLHLDTDTKYVMLNTKKII